MSTLPPQGPQGRPYGKYLLYDAVGQGARGAVYKAYEPAIERLVALRVLAKPGFDSPAADVAFSERARADAQAAARLMHPGIAAVYEYAEDGHDIVVASEFVQGWPLAQALAGQLALGPADVLCIARQLLEALAHAHDAGVAHCHLGPHGVLLGRSGHTKITGFGSARLSVSGDGPSPSTLARRPYTAPECLDGRPGTSLSACMAADVYACGALLRDLMLHATPTTPADHDPHRAGLSRRLEPVWARACAVQPQARPASARQMLAEVLAAADMPVPGMVRVSPAPAAAAPPPAVFPLGDAPGPDAADREATIAILSRMADRFAQGGAPASGPGAASGPPSGSMPGWAASGSPSGGPSVAPSDGSSGRASAWPSWADSRSGSSTTGPAAAATTGSPGTAPAAIDAGALQALTDLLTRHIGPVAVVLVRRHAARAPSLRDLARQLAEEALAPEDHAAFFAQVARLPSAGSAPLAPPPAAARSATGGPREVLPPDWLERVSQAATVYMGPVARVLVRQAAAQAANRDDLVQRVLAQIDDDADRAALASALARVA